MVRYLSREFAARRHEWRSSHAADLLSLLYPELQRPLEECSLLDLGCGPGHLTVAAAEFVRRAVGVDVNMGHLREARRRAKAEGRGNIEFVAEDATRAEALLDTFDIVWCSDVLEHTAHHDALIAAIRNHIAPGGVFYLSTNNRLWPLDTHTWTWFYTYLPRGWTWINAPTLGELRRLLRRHGLRFTLKTPTAPRTRLQGFGSSLVTKFPPMWYFATAFQVVGTVDAGGSSPTDSRPLLASR